MGFRINTNIDAMTAHRNMTGRSTELGKSLERLSSGLRINRAADDASGMTIADSLRAQGSGLGQAMKNAGDAISLVQVADGALDESINIVNTIRTKAIQAASDGQNTVSRAAIQADVNKLLEEMNIIADTTAFNGQTLLKGNFTNKSFQVGAYANQTVSVSIGNADASHVGRLASTSSTATQTNLTSLGTADMVGKNDPVNGDWAVPTSANITVNTVSIGGYLGAQGGNMLSAKGTAAAINAVADTTGVKASAVTNWSGTTNVAAATIADGGLLINGTNIGAVTVLTNDADGALVSAINAVQSTTGVSASVNASGLLTFTAADGRNIQISGASATAAVLGTGLAANTTSVTVVGGTAAAETATANFNLDGVNILWDASSTTATTDNTNLYNALVAARDTAGTISSNYTFTNNGAAGVVITRTDGKDVNILNDNVGNDATILIDTVAANATNGLVKNSSYHGQVTLTSSNSIAIGGDASTLQTFGFAAAGSNVTASGGIADADVTTASAAQTTIQRADSALEALDKVRSGLGSAQNQVEATLRNISVTRVNIQSAESAIRDVDFAEESSTYAKMNILVQAGSYALSQANTVQQNIMTLLR